MKQYTVTLQTYIDGKKSKKTTKSVMAETPPKPGDMINHAMSIVVEVEEAPVWETFVSTTL